MPEAESERSDEERSAGGGLSELVRRAVSAGMGAGRTAKEEITRAAAAEIRGWLDKLDLEKELAKALTALTVEVKTEIRFKSNPDGKIVPEVTATETEIKAAKS